MREREKEKEKKRERERKRENYHEKETREKKRDAEDMYFSELQSIPYFISCYIHSFYIIIITIKFSTSFDTQI